MFTVELNLVSSMNVRTIAGKAVTLDLTKVPAKCLADILTAGALTVLNNTYNGGGSKATEAEKAKKLNAKIESWYQGNYNIVEREVADSITSDMKEAFVANKVRNGMTAKDAEALIRQTVTDVFGKEEKATFPKYLDAVATQLAAANKEEFGTVRDRIEAAATAAAEKLRAERAANNAAIKVDEASLFG